MTNEEALAHFKNHEYMTDFSWQDEMSEVAISAIEKRIPKPLNDVSVFGGVRCGECYTWIDDPDGMNYCPHCGQRICLEA